MTFARGEPDFSTPAPPLWEQAIVVVIITLLTGALVGPIFAPSQQETPILRLMWLPVYAATLGLLLYRAEQMWRAWPAFLLVAIMVCHAFASKYWSIDPEVTTRRTIALAMSSLFALYLGAAFRGPHLPRVIMIACLLMALGSVVMVFAFPAIGVHQGDNAGLWRGLWYEKNQMGVVMVAGMLAAASSLASLNPARDRGWMALSVMTLAFCGLLMLATQSKTSLLCAIIGLGIITALWSMHRGGLAFAVVCLWMSVVLGALFSYFIITETAMILEALGKDPSLTGRVDIWDALMRRVAERPWTGFGYQAFWGRTSVPADWIRFETQWLVPSAHHGWIDLLIQLGWPGGIFVGGVMLLTFVILILRLGEAGAREGYFSLAYFMIVVLLSLSESVLLTNANLPWTLYLATLARCFVPDPQAVRVIAPTRLERGRREAYPTPSRIASPCVHGQASLPVRRRSRT